MQAEAVPQPAYGYHSGERFFRAVKGFVILKWFYCCLIL